MLAVCTVTTVSSDEVPPLHTAVMVVVLAAVAMAICGAVFRLLDGRRGSPDRWSCRSIAVILVIAALLAPSTHHRAALIRAPPAGVG